MSSHFFGAVEISFVEVEAVIVGAVESRAVEVEAVSRRVEQPPVESSRKVADSKC